MNIYTNEQHGPENREQALVQLSPSVPQQEPTARVGHPCHRSHGDAGQQHVSRLLAGFSLDACVFLALCPPLLPQSLHTRPTPLLHSISCTSGQTFQSKTHI